ncbi:MAG: VWA domain-containing protein [Myxococcota bacterium]
MADDTLRSAVRWRLLLGRHAEDPLPLAAPGAGDGEEDARAVDRDRVLSYLYDREHEARGHQRAGTGGSGLTIPAWIRGVRTLFPREAVEVLERDALVRYRLTELVTDPTVLASLEPTLDLVGVILATKHQMAPEVLTVARKVIRTVVDQLAARLRTDATRALRGAPDPDAPPPVRTFRNADWTKTIRKNLRNWDPERRRLGVDRIAYRHRQRARSAWRIILAVDQSGSMLDNLVHASVTAAVFAALPSVTVHLVTWDHRVVDLSDRVHDPLEVLLATQLGGGTNLYPALRYCADLVTVPDRTVLAVVSDFQVFDPPEPSLGLARELATEGVRCLGLCAVTADGRAAYDERFARDLATAGWWVGAVTPAALADRLGRWLG